MLSLLFEIEKHLPELLKNEAQWNGLYVDYHPPIVERLWLQWGENRISLHRIYPCEPHEALFHPHPWPQACRVLEGSYEMAIGYGANHETPPPYAATIVVTEGTSYEMIDPNGWHYVRPLEKPTLSIMITGKPWPSQEKTSEKLRLQPLNPEQRSKLFDDFNRIYRG